LALRRASRMLRTVGLVAVAMAAVVLVLLV
jgi:hypothetical protein